jgi:phosphonate transport system substrate-binding protein
MHTMETTSSRRRALQAALALGLGALGHTAAAAAAGTWTVAVVPQFPATEIHAAWTPALERLSAQTGQAFRLVPYASIPQFETAFRAGTPDFVFLNPYHMVMARTAQQYEPLVRDVSPLTGVLVVPAESPARSLQDLRGQRIAFPAPNAFGASLYLRALLADRGITIEPAYVRTHSNAYRHVLTGDAAAAGGVRQTLKTEDEAVQRGLRVIFETPPSAPHPLAAHPRVPAAVQRAVRDALLGWTARASDAALLAPIQITAPVAADYRRDYAPLERLRLEQFVVAPKP